MPWETPPQIYLTGNTSGTTHFYGPGYTLKGGPNITVSGSGQQIVIKGGAGGAGGGAAISAGTQSTDGGTVLFADSNGVTFGMAGSSKITATVKTDYLTAQTAYVFSNSNGVTWGTNGSTVTATVKTDYLTTARASNDAIGLNTAKTNVTWTVNSSGLSFNAGGYAGTGTAATSASVTLDTSGISINVGPYITTARRSTDAIGLNTAQTNVTWTANSSGLSLDAGGYAGTVTGATNCSVTANTSGVSVSVAAAGGAVTLSRFVHPPPFASISAQANGQNSLYVGYEICPDYVTATMCRLLFNVASASTAAAGTGTVGFSVRFGLYTRNGSSLSSASTGSQSYTASWSSNATASLVGFRDLTIPININMTPGEYWPAFCMSTSTNVRNITLSHYAGNDFNSGPVNPQSIGASSTNNRFLFPGWGTYSVTTGALPSAMSITDIGGAGGALRDANFVWDIANYTVNA